MRQYDSIPLIGEKNLDMASRCADWMIFDKLDGSNLRVELNPKTGAFEKWGSRKTLLDVGNEANILTKAVKIFESSYDGDALRTYLKGQSAKGRFTLFFEFYGPNSFAGQHEPDDVHELRLLDIWEERHGYIAPQALYAACPQYAPPLLGRGAITDELLQTIRRGTLEGMGQEGVIFKHPTDRISKHQTRFKTKRLDWIRKVQDIHKQDWQKFI